MDNTRIWYMCEGIGYAWRLLFPYCNIILNIDNMAILSCESMYRLCDGYTRPTVAGRVNATGMAIASKLDGVFNRWLSPQMTS